MSYWIGKWKQRLDLIYNNQWKKINMDIKNEIFGWKTVGRLDTYSILSLLLILHQVVLSLPLFVVALNFHISI